VDKRLQNDKKKARARSNCGPSKPNRWCAQQEKPNGTFETVTPGTTGRKKTNGRRSIVEADGRQLGKKKS